MAKNHSGHGGFSSRNSHRGTGPHRSWMVNKVFVRKACHGWKDLVLQAYKCKKKYGSKSLHSCLAMRKQLLVCDFDSSISSLVQEMVGATVRPSTMYAIATAIIPRNPMEKNSKDQIIAISATISSLGRKPNEPGSLVCSLKTLLPNRCTAFKKYLLPLYVYR
eukprot:scaffold135312_cov56-Attheya_sp.AAC.1